MLCNEWFHQRPKNWCICIWHGAYMMADYIRRGSGSSRILQFNDQIEWCEHAANATDFWHNSINWKCIRPWKIIRIPATLMSIGLYFYDIILHNPCVINIMNAMDCLILFESCIIPERKARSLKPLISCCLIDGRQRCLWFIREWGTT